MKLKYGLIILVFGACNKDVVTPTPTPKPDPITTISNPIPISTSDTIQIQGSISKDQNGTYNAQTCLLSIYLSRSIPDTITLVAQWKVLNYYFIDTVKIANTREQLYHTNKLFYNEPTQVYILSAKVNNSKYVLRY